MNSIQDLEDREQWLLEDDEFGDSEKDLYLLIAETTSTQNLKPNVSRIIRRDIERLERMEDRSQLQQATIWSRTRLDEYNVDRLKDTLCEFAHNGQTRLAINEVFTRMNAWLLQSRFSVCDQALARMPTESIGVDIALSFLTITYAARERLIYRKPFLERVRKLITQRRGGAIATRLLENLE